MTQHTHDEVIAWIDSKIEQIENESPALDPVADWRMIEILKSSIASLLANRDTLERHQERLSIFHNCGEEDCREMVARRILESIYTDIAESIRSVM